jgi:ATP-binding cassette, subfamily B, multidrug efflux pump
MRGGYMHRLASEKKDRDYRLSQLDKNIIKLLIYYLKPYWKRIILAVLAMFIVTATTLMGPFLTKIAIDNYILPGNIKGLYLIFLFLLLVYGILWISSYWQKYLSNLIGQGVIRDIRKDLYKHLLELSMNFFVNNKKGQIISRIIHDVESLSDLVSTGMIYLINDILTLTGIILIMFFMNKKITLITMIIIPFVYLLISFLGKKINMAYQDVRSKMAQLNIGVEENISGIRVVQSMSREKENIGRFVQLSRENLKANLKAVSFFALFFPIMNITAVLGNGLVLFFGGIEVMEGRMTLGVLAAFLGYVTRFFFPLRDLSQAYNTYQAAAASLERINEYLEIKSDIRKKNKNRISNFKFSERIKFEDVFFTYNNIGENDNNTGKRLYTLKNINFELKAGENLAIVGPSGAGKTTLIRLLAHLYEIREGRILFDNIDIKDLPPNIFHKMIKIVPQNIYLFPGSIKENIAYGKAGASNDEIIKAANKVYAHHFIKDLPRGYETEIGEGGVRLSGGQRQLISFARAIISDPDILILDEATSNIDVQTEKLLAEAMESIFLERTVLIIAHRFLTLKKAERIVVLDDGEIKAIGNHDELMEISPLYRSLYEKQFK